MAGHRNVFDGVAHHCRRLQRLAVFATVGRGLDEEAQVQLRNASGQVELVRLDVVPRLQRFDGGSAAFGYSAGLYDGATTVDIGLTGAEHTRDDGYKESYAEEINEAGPNRS